MKSIFMAIGMLLAFVSAWLQLHANGLFENDRHLPSEYVMSNKCTVKMYNTFMYSSLHAERIEDMKSMPVRNEDIMTLNEMLGSTKDRNTRNYPVLSDGIFVEVRPEHGSVYGIYVNNIKYTIIAEDGQSILQYYTYTVPKGVKPRIDSLLSHYRSWSEYNSALTRFDSLPAALVLNRNMCLFNPNRKTVDATFYVILDSCSHTVLPVTYRISKRKKNIHVSREIPIWERLKYTERDEDGTIHVCNSNGVSWDVKEYNDACNGEDILAEYFQNWQNMTNNERMRKLDRYLE